MQLLLMGLFLPVLFLSRYPAYHFLRWALAGFTTIAALVWLTERGAGQAVELAHFF